MSSGIRPLKRLGQHFLTNENVAIQIAEAITFHQGYSKLLEIGPGTGFLTEKLLNLKNVELYCMEIDGRSIDYLIQRFPELKNKIIHDDFLNAPFPFADYEKFGIIGNFPYNISSQILFRILDQYEQVPEVTGMFQKEVALRIASPPGSRDYGILSVFLQAHYDIEYLFTVPASDFNPPPKVQSGVIRLRLKNNHILDCDKSEFRKVVKTGFNQRRKTLRNSLRSLLPQEISNIPYLDKRPEQLHYLQFIEITQKIFNN